MPGAFHLYTIFVVVVEMTHFYLINWLHVIQIFWIQVFFFIDYTYTHHYFYSVCVSLFGVSSKLFGQVTSSVIISRNNPYFVHVRRY